MQDDLPVSTPAGMYGVGWPGVVTLSRKFTKWKYLSKLFQTFSFLILALLSSVPIHLLHALKVSFFLCHLFSFLSLTFPLISLHFFSAVSQL